MLGAIIGDVVGSRFEWANHRNKDFDFFHPDCHYTDDTVLTVAIARAFLVQHKFDTLEESAIYWLQHYGKGYPDAGYGGLFQRWLNSKNPTPYDSFGNGSAMRVSPCANWATTMEEAVQYSQAVTEVTHNHIEGIKGAEAVTKSIFMAKKGSSIKEIKDMIKLSYYPVDFSLNEIRKDYKFQATCQGSVPQALVAFFESNSFEDAIRNAVSIGGDSDTIAAITGSIAEAYYQIPMHLITELRPFLGDNFIDVIAAFYNRITT